jgi:hypothetical protein
MTPCSTKSTKASFSSGSARLRLKRLPLTTRRMTRSSISVRHKVSALAPISEVKRLKPICNDMPLLLSESLALFAPPLNERIANIKWLPCNCLFLLAALQQVETIQGLVPTEPTDPLARRGMPACGT